MKSIKSIASIFLAALLALPAAAVIEISTSKQTTTDQTVLPTKADPGTPVAGELFLSTTTANRLKYYSGGTLFTLSTSADLVAGYQPLDAALTALAAGSDFVQFTGPSTSTKIYTLPNTSTTIITAADTGTVTNTMLAGAIDLTTKVTGILPAANGGTGNGFTAFTGPASSTKTYTLPNTSTTIITAADTGTVTNTMLAGSIDLTTKVTGILPAANGGTGNGFTLFSGPTTSTKTFTLPDASGTILTSTQAQIPSTNTTGFQVYNTADQVTTVQRMDLRYTSSVAFVMTKTVGTIGSTPLILGSQTSNGGNQYNYFRIDRGASPLLRQGIYTSESGTTLDSTTIPTWWSIGNGTSTASSGTVLIFSITPTLNQTGSAATTDILVSTNITAAGTGLQKFLDLQVNGTSWYSFTRGNAPTTGAFNSSSAVETAITLTPSFASQTGTAGWQALRINATDGSGTGQRDLISLATGGATVFRVNYVGAVYAAAGFLSTSPTLGIGYSSGAGGTQTQATSKATGVTLNKVTGEITLNSASLAGDATVSFTYTNSAIAAGDLVTVQHVSGGTLGAYTFASTAAAGSATIYVHNVTTGALAEAIVIKITVIKAVTA